MDLPLDDHRVDDVAAVVDGDEAAHLDLAGAAVDVDHADVAAEREGEVRRIVVVHRLQPRLHPLRMVGVGGEGDLLDGLRLRSGAPLTENLPGSHSRSSARTSSRCAAIFLALSRILRAAIAAGGARGRRRAAGVGAEAVGRGVGVALLHLDVRGRDAQLLGDDLRVGRLVPLALATWCRSARSPCPSDGRGSRPSRTS